LRYAGASVPPPARHPTLSLVISGGAQWLLRHAGTFRIWSEVLTWRRPAAAASSWSLGRCWSLCGRRHRSPVHDRRFGCKNRAQRG